ncbi:hypothetical protein BG015_011387 [Linnemannia schmuckeri]|uniref:Uncharacterized protein n=1 Tax=Linnemannia schmuckeri TaxID=64567 RepID=A0A9P5RVF6_9FUNG|nr:hypothetical protein BG015_011387 [Linnemannia schmuckeri]
MATILRTLPSRKLIGLDRAGEGQFGPMTFSCLREMYFGHLQELKIEQCVGVSSAMVQEIMMECAHLIILEAPYVFIRDIVTAPKPWSCLKLKEMTVYIAKQEDDEVGWDGLVFEQISKLRRLRSLDLQRNPRYSSKRIRPETVMDLETLDLRLPGFCNSGSSSDGGGCDIRCWSNLVQLGSFCFDGDRQVLGMKEALWMVEHWRDLTTIWGEFEAVEGNDVDKLDTLFKKKGVNL